MSKLGLESPKPKLSNHKHLRRESSVLGNSNTLTILNILERKCGSILLATTSRQKKSRSASGSKVGRVDVDQPETQPSSLGTWKRHILVGPPKRCSLHDFTQYIGRYSAGAREEARRVRVVAMAKLKEMIIRFRRQR
jgi:hypothetical protein